MNNRVAGTGHPLSEHPPSTRQIVRQGCSVSYAVRGSGSPVVLIHGLGSSGKDFAPSAAFLAHRFLVVTPDLRGHGRSSTPLSPYTMKDLAADVGAVIEHAACGPCHVVGLSLGGMVAFQLALDFRGLVQSLSIVNSGPEVVPRTFRDFWRIRTRLFGAQVLPMRTLGKGISKNLFPRADQEELRRLFVDGFSRNDRRAYNSALSAIVGWSVTDRIAHIRVPTLVLSGDRDYTSVDVKRRYAAKIPGAVVRVIQDSGHATPVDQPDRFNATVLEFLTEVESTSGRHVVEDVA